MEKIMHCPRCGHQQNADKIRFCTKCGFEMSNVKELLTSELSETKAKKREIAKARRQGMIMMISGFGLILLFAGVREFYPLPKFIALFMLFIMFLGAIRMAMPSFFGKDNLTDIDNDLEEIDSEIDKLFGGQVSDKTLPEAEYRPPLDFETKTFDTNELLEPASVTENTTRKLKKELQQE
jgi:ribosomal protein L37E